MLLGRSRRLSGGKSKSPSGIIGKTQIFATPKSNFYDRYSFLGRSETPDSSNMLGFMRLPIIPFLVAALLLGAAWYFFNPNRSTGHTLDAPHITRLVDRKSTRLNS